VTPPDDEIDWDVVPPPPTTAFDRIQTRTVAVARSSRRRLPESRRTAALVAGVLVAVTLSLVATWWIRRPPPGDDHDLLVRLTESSETFRPSYVTTDPEQAEAYVADVFGWDVGVPVLPGFRLAGVGEASLSPQLSVPAVRYDGPDGAPVVVFAYDYVFLDQAQGALDLPEATYAQLAEPVPVDARRLGDAALVSWRRRAVIYTAVTASDDAVERIGRAVRDADTPAVPDSVQAPPREAEVSGESRN
jgi:hypothetical protein